RDLAGYIDQARKNGSRSPAVIEAAVSEPTEELERALLETVSDRTGYPVNMLELDMRLDADLGIDSIKRVEILSAMQDRFPGVPPANPEGLGALGTLREVAAFLGQTRVSSAPEEARFGKNGDRPVAQAESIERELLGVVSEKTGYPADMI